MTPALTRLPGGVAIENVLKKRLETGQPIANHYRDLLKGFVIDKTDMGLIKSVKELNIQTHVTYTLMKSHDDRKQLADEVINFIREVL